MNQFAVSVLTDVVPCSLGLCASFMFLSLRFLFFNTGQVESHVEDALSKGAKCIRGGKRHNLGGNFFQPTVLTDVTGDMTICDQETFGPVAPLIRCVTVL